MKCLIDTAVFLWMIFDESDKFSKKAHAVLEDDKNDLYFSAVSAWEIAIKYSIGKLDLRKNPIEWLPNIILKMGLHLLPVSHHHAFAVMKLPLHHRDPFDRLLVCQSKLENIPLITSDRIFKKYKVKTIW